MAARRVLAPLLALVACSDPAPLAADESTSATTDGDVTDTADTDDAPTFVPAAPAFPRLTRRQYFNSTRDLLGPNLPVPQLEPDQDPHFFTSVGAATATLSEHGAQQYEEAADLLARHVFTDDARRLALVGCTPAAADDPCAGEFLAAFARRAYRRPLTADERTRWLTIAAELANGDPWRGLRFAVAGILQSPHFLYRVERGEPDPADPTNHRLTAHELAARLSFLLWNTGPDDALLAAADRGELHTPDVLTTHAERLLNDPRARAAVLEFFGEVLDLRRLDDITRDPVLHPKYTPELPAAMRREVELVLEDLIFRRDADLRELHTTRRSFNNSALAALYGTSPAGADAITYIPVQLPEERAGLLSLAAFLTLTAHPAETSPTRRGKYLRERILCQSIPPPPPDVDASLDPPDDDKPTTLRERLEAHRSDPACSGCHSVIDPPGFLFEHFDPIGNYRSEDSGQPIDASGDLDGVPLAGVRDLADLLADDDRIAPCIVTMLHRHASARLSAPGEQPALTDLAEQFTRSGHRFRALLHAYIRSDAFNKIKIAAPEVDP